MRSGGTDERGMKGRAEKVQLKTGKVCRQRGLRRLGEPFRRIYNARPVKGRGKGVPAIFVINRWSAHVLRRFT